MSADGDAPALTPNANQVSSAYRDLRRNVEINVGKVCNNKCVFCLDGMPTKEDLAFIIKAGFDWVAASFIGHGDDIRSIKRFMAGLGASIPLVAKVESAQAVENLEGIVDAAEGVMVARGDLGVELDLELIPAVQREVIKIAREKGKLTIVATQMLESMMTSARPSRAEVTDVSTAALARVDALMPFGEASR